MAKAQFPSLSQEQCFAYCYRLALQATRESYFGDLRVYATLHLEALAQESERLIGS
ncbi:hypothetical protein D3C81_2077810 [compost metagenome]